MSDKYILEGHKVVPADLATWSKWFEKAGDARTVRKTTIGAVDVSTVFLGLDHNYGEKGPPLIFETMIFGGAHDEYQDRCSTWEEAEAMHAKACELVAKS